MIKIAKNIEGESGNKLTIPKLIAYDDTMPTNNMIKYKSPEYHVSGYARLASKSLIAYVIEWSSSFNMTQTNTATRRELK